MGIVYQEGPNYRQTKMTIFAMRTLFSVSVFIFGFLILLGKRRLPFRRDKYQYNVLTLKETLAIVVIFYLSTLNYLIEIDKYLEMLILSAVSLLIPVFLIIKTKRSYPILWTKLNHTRKYQFFMTRHALKPRPSCKCEIFIKNEKKRKFIYVKSSS